MVTRVDVNEINMHSEYSYFVLTYNTVAGTNAIEQTGYDVFVYVGRSILT